MPVRLLGRTTARQEHPGGCRRRSDSRIPVGSHWPSARRDEHARLIRTTGQTLSRQRALLRRSPEVPSGHAYSVQPSSIGVCSAPTHDGLQGREVSTVHNKARAQRRASIGVGSVAGYKTNDGRRRRSRKPAAHPPSSRLAGRVEDATPLRRAARRKTSPLSASRNPRPGGTPNTGTGVVPSFREPRRPSHRAHIPL